MWPICKNRNSIFIRNYKGKSELSLGKGTQKCGICDLAYISPMPTKTS